MTKLPLISSQDMEKMLKHLGFERKRQVGSHVFYRHLDGRTTVIPFHQGEELGRGLLRKILRDIKLEPEEYIILKQSVL